MRSERDENEKVSRSQFMKRSSNHVTEFGLYSKESTLSTAFRLVFTELATSGRNMFLFTETQGE